MRIGILTFHAAHNYGAVLQCYSLQEYLKSLGHDVSVIDYQNKRLLTVYQRFSLERIIKKNPVKMIKNIITEILIYQKRKQRYNAFQEFISNNIKTEPVESITKLPFDIIFIGSDQVWNYKLTYGFDSYYWGDFVRPSHTILASYAASMQDNWPESKDEIISSKLKNFDFVSVRELSLAQKLQMLSPSKKVYHVVDPTLLLPASMWNCIANKSKVNKPYVLFYQVDVNPLARQIAQAIANREGLQLLVISANIQNENDNVAISASPADFLSLIKESAMVVSASFHATVFSILFKKNFYSIKGHGKNARINSLLSSCGLNNRIIDHIPNEIIPVDYSMVSIDKINKESILYIDKVIKAYEQ